MTRLNLLCLKALEDQGLSEEYRNRLKIEVQEIERIKEADYFLDLYDRGIRYAANQHNSIVPWLLGIVPNFDISRDAAYASGDLPDVDVDFLQEARDYVKNVWAPKRFGESKVCNVGNYGTYGMRSSLIDVAKIYGEDRDEMLEITKILPNKDDDGNHITWDKALELTPSLKAFADDHPEIVELARRLSESEWGARNKSAGKHAGGLIISSKDLSDFVPLVVDKDGLITSAWPEGLHAQELGPVGLVKFDLLVITNLRQIANIATLIKRRHGIDGICNLPGQEDWSDESYLNDSKSLEMANRGDLKCVFQFDSPGIRKLAKAAGVTRFEDMVALTAIFRPGPLASGMGEVYTNRKRGKEKYDLHPLLEPILNETYGVLVYQEQIMQILHLIGDVPLADCEKVRKAISKKKSEIFGTYKSQFIKNGAIKLRRDCKPIFPEDYKQVIEKVYNNEASFEENVSNMAHYAFQQNMEDPYIKSMGYVFFLIKRKYADQDIIFDGVKYKLDFDFLHFVVARQSAKYLWELIERFAEYGFNASHACAYTVLSARLLYLKSHFPLEFYTGVLMSEKKEEKIRDYKIEAAVHKVKLEPIDLNRSKVTFALHEVDGKPSSNDKPYYGLSNIKGIGEEVAGRIVEGQPYNDFEDFLTRFGTGADVVKPLLALRVFGEDMEAKYKYYEDFKEVKTKAVNQVKKYIKNLERYEQQLREKLSDNPELASWDKYEEWVIFDQTEIIEVNGRRRKINKYKELLEIRKKWINAGESLKEAEVVVRGSLLPWDTYNPELSEVYINDELREQFQSLELAQKKYLGFVWDHPLTKCEGFTGKTFGRIKSLSDDPDTNGGSEPVEVLLINCSKRDWKNGKGHNYKLEVEDANGEKGFITVWSDDYDRFKTELIPGNFLRLAVLPPDQYGYTLYSPPRYKRRSLPPKQLDYRVIVLGRNEKETE